MEKTKQALESEFNELQIELKTLGQSKLDSEHRRKKAESQVQELQVKYGDSERQKQEALENVAKLQVGSEEDGAGGFQTVLKVQCLLKQSLILSSSRSLKA